jgi:galactokinase
MGDARGEAPGRVNLIGEHTDYHDGFVLPCAIPQRCVADLRRRDDRRVRAWSRQIAGADPFEYAIGAEHRTASWGDYVQGLTWALSQQGIPVGGFDLHLDSEIPLGSGLSSSAALEIATLRALRSAFDLQIDEVQMARIAQRAEVEFVGAPVGIMDQMAASLAGERVALFLDARSLEFERISFPEGLDLVVIDSGIAHQHTNGDYATRRRESEEAAGMLGLEKLRDANLDRLEEINALPQILAKRARHIVTENARVLEARAALKRSDLESLGRLLVASHASMRDDYEISIPAIDLIVTLAMDAAGVFGARMTGGGFGGAVVIAAASGTAASVAADVSVAYAARSGNRCEILVPLHK